MEKQPNPFLRKLSNLLVPKYDSDEPKTVSNERILDELVDCFEASLDRESIGSTLLFNAHFLIILHPASFEERLAALPVIVDEAVKRFTERLKQRRGTQGRIKPVSSHWFFKFGPGTEFDGRAIGPGDVEVIGSLSSVGLGSPAAAPTDGPPERIKATRKVKNTNLYERMDTNRLAFQHIDFRETGAFAIEIDRSLLVEPPPETPPAEPPVNPAGPKPAPVPAQTKPQPVEKKAASPSETWENPTALARIHCYFGDKNTEETHWMQDREVVIARKEPDNEWFHNYLRLDSPYVSNPHARIRFNEAAGRFEIASFSRHETRLNEQVVARSEPASPQWVELPSKSQILLNGVVTLTFQGNR